MKVLWAGKREEKTGIEIIIVTGRRLEGKCPDFKNS